MVSRERRNYSIFGLTMVVFAELAVICFLLSSDYARHSTLVEGGWIANQLGDGTNLEIQKRADWLYESTVVQWELNAWFYQLFIPTPEERENSRGLETLGEQWFPIAEERWSAFLDMVYWGMRRIALFSIWLPIWLPAFIMSALVGWLERAIKKTGFGYTSPIVFTLSWRTLFCTFLVLVISFLCPTPIPPVVVPALLGFVAILLGFAVGNIQKRI